MFVLKLLGKVVVAPGVMGVDESVHPVEHDHGTRKEGVTKALL